MKYAYKVVREFTDKESGKKYVVGADYPANISKARVKTLLHKDNQYKEQYIAIVLDNDLTKAELIEVANDNNIEVSEKDTKANIIKVLEG